MAKPLLSLCGLPKQALRDGNAAPYAKLVLPFLDSIWFADGSTGTFQGTTVPQYLGATFSGTVKPNVYHKDCCCDLGEG